LARLGSNPTIPWHAINPLMRLMCFYPSALEASTVSCRIVVGNQRYPTLSTACVSL
jgi:hypothetical protein